MSTTSSFIKRFVNMLRQGQLFTAREVLRYGCRATVDTVLFRLVKAEMIRRVARGVFMRNDWRQPDPPLEEVARVKAHAFARRIVTAGANAASGLGLAEPLDSAKERIYATDGRTSSFKVGALVVRLQGVAPRKIQVGDNKAGLAIKALWYLGKQSCSRTTMAQAVYPFRRTDREELPRLAPYMPGWMADLFNWRKVWEEPEWAART